jgi:hypothetical protein
MKAWWSEMHSMLQVDLARIDFVSVRITSGWLDIYDALRCVVDLESIGDTYWCTVPNEVAN